MVRMLEAPVGKTRALIPDQRFVHARAMHIASQQVARGSYSATKAIAVIEKTGLSRRSLKGLVLPAPR